MLSDIEIAQKNSMKPVQEIASALGLSQNDFDLYGTYKAKLTLPAVMELQKKARSNPAKLVLVTAITPTPAGEGKSTVSVGLGDGLNRIGKKTVIALREPSLGPCFGVKGGACGGGYSQIVPMEDINLHFTGDIHAVSITTNLIASIIDNHIQQGNQLNIDPRTISWKRCVDLNDRALRKVIVGLGGRTDGVPREDGFTIAVASEIMAILCLSRSIPELKERLGNIVIGSTYDGRMVQFKELNAVGACAALMKDAIRPNLVQTLEKNPAFVHGGPFANIAHGCNSLNATFSALALGDYVITEAGFAADLGAEKFLDIKCRLGGLTPSAVVVVATIRALKMHGGVEKANLSQPNVEAVEKGFENLKVHLENLAQFGLPTVVAVNQFVSDTQEEIDCLQSLCKKSGAQAVLCQVWEKGGEGGQDLARAVVEICEKNEGKFTFLYPDELPLTEKIEVLAKKLYRAKAVDIAPAALKKLQKFQEAGYGNLPICMAKTQNSISHNASWRGAPRDYTFPVRDVQLYAGAGFVVALAGDIMTMPGLPKVPAACSIDVDDMGNISGLF
ncbi:MAG: formate--tetrahydrofolate ligase [Treponema sp.]|nr:formate--tetrahydrofolate ligase [Treponema sp.]MDY4675106.1 formate--tetrahydrofolate ligase [Treponema sp.]